MDKNPLDHIKHMLNLSEDQIKQLVESDVPHDMISPHDSSHENVGNQTPPAVSANSPFLKYFTSPQKNVPYSTYHANNPLIASSSAIPVHEQDQAHSSNSFFMELQPVGAEQPFKESSSENETPLFEPLSNVQANIASTSDRNYSQAEKVSSQDEIAIRSHEPIGGTATDLNFKTISKLAYHAKDAGKENGDLSLKKKQNLQGISTTREITEVESFNSISKALDLDLDIEEKKKVSAMPKMAQRLIGEANTRLAMGDYDKATDLCLEVIKIAPWTAMPFQTLSEIYDHKNDPDRAFQYEVLAAHLTATSFAKWVSLAQACEEKGDIVQAIGCYNRAAKMNDQDYKCRWRLGVLYQQLGNFKMSMEKFKSVVKSLPETAVNECMEFARDIARSSHSNGKTNIALSTLYEAAEKHPQAVTHEDTNMACELLISLKQYDSVLKLLMQRSEIMVEYEDDKVTVKNILVDPNVPIDLMSKLVISCIRLQCVEKIQQSLDTILALSPVDVGDVQFDIAEVYMDMKQYQEAIGVLEILVDSSVYSLAGVWLKKAECHRNLMHYDKAKLCYMQVIDKAPGHTKALLDLSFVLRQLKQFKEALQIIGEAENYETDETEQILIHLERYIVYKQWAVQDKNNYDLKVHAGDAALILLAIKLKHTFTNSHGRINKVWLYLKVQFVKRKRRLNHEFLGERTILHMQRDTLRDDDVVVYDRSGDPEIFDGKEWLDMIVESVNLLTDTKRYRDAIYLLEMSLHVSAFYNRKEIRRMLEIKMLQTCIKGENYAHAYQLMRLWLISTTDITTMGMWNLFNQVVYRTNEQRHHKFCLRYSGKHPDDLASMILNGHNSLTTGSYKYSLSEYMGAYKKEPNNPLYLFLIGIVYIQISTQKFSTYKKFLIAQGLAFLYKYCELRGIDQESYYNVGRALQQVGAMSHAMHFYHVALETPPIKLNQGSDHLLDLKMEIAFNLSVIYRQSGNNELADEVLEKYCIV